jgi:hypothetical protein
MNPMLYHLSYIRKVWKGRFELPTSIKVGIGEGTLTLDLCSASAVL